MTTNPRTWVPTEGATETERDQEIDLGDAWHAVVGPDGDRWTWEVWDTWLHDDESRIIASGSVQYEMEAKIAAINAHTALR